MSVVLGSPWGMLGCWAVSVKTRYTNMEKTAVRNS